MDNYDLTRRRKKQLSTAALLRQIYNAAMAGGEPDQKDSCNMVFFENRHSSVMLSFERKKTLMVIYDSGTFTAVSIDKNLRSAAPNNAQAIEGAFNNLSPDNIALFFAPSYDIQQQIAIAELQNIPKEQAFDRLISKVVNNFHASY